MKISEPLCLCGKIPFEFSNTEAERVDSANFSKKTNDSEKAHLRLEVEKLRRAEGDWVQVLVRILDHIFAVKQAAANSAQPKLIEQMGNFHTACLDIARRVGLTAFVANASEPFDQTRRQNSA